MNDEARSPERDFSDPRYLPATVDGQFSRSDSSERTRPSASARAWRQELARWLATLNPGRTQREYEKAIGYFFETPGVPQELDGVSFDLLVAYRGALALRATPHEQRPSTSAAGRARARLTAGTARMLAGETPGTNERDAPASSAAAPLSPATVNVRLTALCRFLAHCSLMGTLPQLSSDQIHAALRRLSIERRRPYQILAEQEWEQFLLAAQMPRQRQAADVMERNTPGETSSDAPAPTPHPSLPKSRAGLTGERTAERDYALIALALATGLRAVELASLDLGDLARDWHKGVEEWWLVLPDAKTKGQRGGRTLPLAPSLVETVLAYVKSTGRRWDDANDRATPLFLSQTRRRGLRAEGRYPRLSPAHIRSIVDRVETHWLALRSGGEEHGAGSAMLAGETRRISPHALRHSTAIALLEGSSATGRPPASVEHVRGWLGHFDIRTTQGYLAHLDARRHRRPFALTPGASSNASAGATPPEPEPESQHADAALESGAEEQSES